MAEIAILGISLPLEGFITFRFFNLQIINFQVQSYRFTVTTFHNQLTHSTKYWFKNLMLGQANLPPPPPFW